MKTIKDKNTQCLAGFDFTKDINLIETVGQYGAPQVILDNINKPTSVITYSELLCFYGSKLSKVNYLELGCSFGKNFWQVMNYFGEGNFIACDLEKINPNLAERLPNGTNFWSETASGKTRSVYSMKRETGTHYIINEKKHVYYMCGDLFSPNIYEAIPFVNKTNLVFSDALHDPRALPFEVDNLISKDILDKEEFIIYYDDLHGGEMIGAFHECSRKLSDFSYKPVRNRIFNCHGWIGEHEFIHTNGIITNTDVDLEWEKYEN
jgi:hypothetical protein